MNRIIKKAPPKIIKSGTKNFIIWEKESLITSKLKSENIKDEIKRKTAENPYAKLILLWLIFPIIKIETEIKNIVKGHASSIVQGISRVFISMKSLVI